MLDGTPDFYNVSKNLSDPEVDSDDWTLKVTGRVEKEIELTTNSWSSGPRSRRSRPFPASPTSSMGT